MKNTAGVFINVVFCMVMLLKPLKRLTTINNQFQKVWQPAPVFLKFLMKQTKKIKGKPKTRNREELGDDVTFSYPGKQTPALSNVSFIANPGQSIALVDAREVVNPPSRRCLHAFTSARR